MNFNFDLSSNLNYNSSSYFSNFGLNSLPPDIQVQLRLGTQEDNLSLSSLTRNYIFLQGEIVLVSTARINVFLQQRKIVFVK